jgi:hypothetical protein
VNAWAGVMPARKPDLSLPPPAACALHTTLCMGLI